MLGSIYIGLSGLNAYSQGLQLVSNNVANMNSQGYVSSTIDFDDLVSAGGNGAAYDHVGTSGYGVGVGGEYLDFSQGEMRQTDRPLDLAVDGSGFLMLMRGGDIAYTRTGSFEVDDSGHIVLSGTDYRLAMLDNSGRPVSVSVNAHATSAPSATRTVTFTGNLAGDATTFSVPNIRVVDAHGEQRLLTATFKKKSHMPGAWIVQLRPSDAAATSTPIATRTITFTDDTISTTNSRRHFTDAESGLDVTFDFTGTTSYDTNEIASTLRTSSIDGYTTGTLSSVSVNDEGHVELGYSNEQTEDLGAVALAAFREPQALVQRTGGLFTETRDAGREIASGSAGLGGRVLAKRLEASNVNLSKQFGNLILIQRGFQASSQIISAANDMIQQLFGMHGQG